MQTEPTSRKYRGHVLVPVIDDETSGILCWEAYPDHPDWRHVTDREPVATGNTLTEVMADVRDHIHFEKAFGWRHA